MKTLFNDAERATLGKFAAAPEMPGTILRDFGALLDAIGDEGLPVSPKTSEFAMAHLPAINALLVEPARIGLARGRQISYPHVDALHLLLRASRLGRLDRSQATARFKCDPATGERWRALNPTERYFALLEAWWVFMPEDAGLNSFAVGDQADFRAKLLSMLARRGKGYQDAPKDFDSLLHWLGMAQLALLQMFGMIEVQQAEAVAGSGWRIRQLSPTPWGQLLCASYGKAASAMARLEAMLGVSDADAAEPESDLPPFHRWAAELSPLFPAWRNGLGEVPEEAPVGGVITFKVSYGADIWRRIAMPGESTFADLALTILGAFHFDDEGLYGFAYKDDYGNRKLIDDHRLGGGIGTFGESADAVALGTEIRAPKKRIDFRYDDRQFEILVEKVDAVAALSKATVIARQGKAPKQYPREAG